MRNATGFVLHGSPEAPETGDPDVMHVIYPLGGDPAAPLGPPMRLPASFVKRCDWEAIIAGGALHFYVYPQAVPH